MSIIVQTRQSTYQNHADICRYEIFGEKPVLSKIEEPINFMINQESILDNDCLNIYRKTLTKLRKHSDEIDERLEEIKQSDRFYWAKKEERKEYSQLKDDKKQTLKDILYLSTHIDTLKENMSKNKRLDKNAVDFFENLGFEATSRIVEDAEKCISSTFEYPKSTGSLIKALNEQYLETAIEYANKLKRFLKEDKKFKDYVDDNTLNKLINNNNDRINNPITLEKDIKEMY